EAQGQHAICELLWERVPADDRIRQLPQLLEPRQNVRPSTTDGVDLCADTGGLADVRRCVRLAVLQLRDGLALRLLRLDLGLRRLSRSLLRALLSLRCGLTRLVRRGGGIMLGRRVLAPSLRRLCTLRWLALRGRLSLLPGLGLVPLLRRLLGWLTLLLHASRVGLSGSALLLRARLVRTCRLTLTRVGLRSPSGRTVLGCRLLAARLLACRLRGCGLLGCRLLGRPLLGSALLCRGALRPLIQDRAGRGHRVRDSRVRVGILGRCRLSACTRCPPAGTAGVGRGCSALLSHTLRHRGPRSHTL